MGLNRLKDSRMLPKVVSQESQGGRTWVESEPGQGATFKFFWRKALD